MGDHLKSDTKKTELLSDNSGLLHPTLEQYNEVLQALAQTREIISKIKEGIIVYDKDLRYKEWNAFMENLTGYKKEAVIGKHPSELFPFFIKQGLVEKLEEIIKGNSNGYSIEFPFSIPGTEKIGHVSETNEPLYDAEGNITGVLGTVSDITQQKKVYEAFLNSNELLSLFLKHSPIYAYIKEVTPTESRSLMVSDNYEIMLGIKASDIIGKTMGELFPPDLAKKMTEDDYSVIVGGEVITLEEELNNRKYLSIKFPIVLSDRKLLAGYTIDITDIKNTEESLRSIKDLLLSITNGTTDIIFTKDRNGKYTFINKSLEKFFGKQKDEIIGKDLNDIIPDSNGGSLLEKEKIVIEKGEYLSYEEVLKDGAGETRIFSINKGPIYDSKGNIDGLFGISRDITEQKRKDRLLKIREEQLKRKEKMESIGVLAGGIAHDFNNLLTPMMGYLDLLMMDNTLSSKQREYLEKVMLSTRRASESTKQIQTFSKNTISEKEGFDISSLITEVFDFVEKENGDEIKKINDLKPGEFFVYGNESEIHQVLLNLVINSSNAIKDRGYKGEDYIRIKAENYRSSDLDETSLSEGDFVHIIFEDNGKGMSEDVLSKAFDPFFTTKGKNQQRGQGLGLSMVYNIITNKHNGHIHLESKEGVGTKVHIYLPKALSNDKVKQKESLNIDSGSETILLIEDDKMIQDMAKLMLEKNGYKVFVANDGKEGLDMYIEMINDIDLVILDLTMPRMSGQTVLEKMVKIKGDVNVIISSGQNDQEKNEGILSKAKGFVHKPYTMSELFGTIREVLDKQIQE